MAQDEDDDRRVARRSNKDCRDIARNTKAYYGVGRVWPVNIGRILRSGIIPTLRGERPLIYEVVEDELLGNKDAATALVDGAVKITVKKSVDAKAAWGDGRSRMTIAHELGHGVMHASEGSVDHRATGAVGTTTLSKLNASESAAHQAKEFASAFLIDDERAAELGSPMEIATEFLVSLSAAEICYERIEADRERAAAAARVLKASKEFQALMHQNEKATNYLTARCVVCKSQTLLPLGTKVGCETCRFVGDHPEDG